MHDQQLRSYFALDSIMPGFAEAMLCCKAGGTSFDYWTSKVSSGQFVPTIAEGYSRLTSGRNDVLLLSPDNHSLDASLTWAKNMTHLVGAGPSDLGMNKRTRIGMSTTFTPMITVSGYGNLFRNVYTMHGTAATDLIGIAVSGARNTFDGCHLGGPMNAAQGGHASYEGVTVDGSENRFLNCVLGTDTIGRDEGSPNVTLGAGTLTIFKNCLFLANLTDGDPVFIKAENTSGYTWALFDNCHFMAFNSNYATAMTKAVECTGSASCALNFTPTCTFQNVTALADATDDSFVWYPVTFSTTTDTAALLSVKLAV